MTKMYIFVKNVVNYVYSDFSDDEDCDDGECDFNKNRNYDSLLNKKRYIDTFKIKIPI